MDGDEHLGADFRGGAEECVERVDDPAADGVFHGNEAVVGVAADDDCGLGRKSLLTTAATREQVIQSRAISLHHEPIRPGNRLQRGFGVKAQDERIIQAARTLDHCSAPAAPSKDRDVEFAAGCKIYFAFDPVRITDHDEMPVGLPEAEHLGAVAFVAPVEQRFVAGKVFFRARQGQVQVFQGPLSVCVRPESSSNCATAANRPSGEANRAAGQK